MSCWASLADSYAESGPSAGLFDIRSQMGLSEGGKPPKRDTALFEMIMRHSDEYE